VLKGDSAKAKGAYQDFLTLWKDADPDIPIFIDTKSEYAKLKWSLSLTCLLTQPNIRRQ
jgi:hypothetical protein